MMRHPSLVRDGLLAAAFLGLVWLAALKLGETGETLRSGQVRVVDGDTLVLGTTRIRLLGIDAPERAQTCLRADREWACGQEASRHLTRLVGKDDVACLGRSKDRYGRMLATCAVGSEAADLSARMVFDGYAVAFGRYQHEEAEARAKGRGLWSGSFDQPKDWRARHGGMAEGPHIDLDGLTAIWRRIEGLWTTP